MSKEMIQEQPLSAFFDERESQARFNADTWMAELQSRCAEMLGPICVSSSDAEADPIGPVANINSRTNLYDWSDDGDDFTQAVDFVPEEAFRFVSVSALPCELDEPVFAVAPARGQYADLFEGHVSTASVAIDTELDKTAATPALEDTATLNVTYMESWQAGHRSRANRPRHSPERQRLSRARRVGETVVAAAVVVALAVGAAGLLSKVIAPNKGASADDNPPIARVTDSKIATLPDITTTSTTIKAEIPAPKISLQALVEEARAKVVAEEAEKARIKAEKLAAMTDSEKLSLAINHMCKGPMGSPYGMRQLEDDPAPRLHAGIDVKCGEDTELRPMKAGTVLHAGWFGGYGNAVVVDHGEGISTLYGHMNSISVSAGEVISADTLLGLIGNTGHSFGAHLHFEVRKDAGGVVTLNGVPMNPVPTLIAMGEEFALAA